MSTIGPGELAQAGVAGGPAFVMSRTEWLAIQTYAVDASALPITEAQLKTALGPGAPKDSSDFQPLLLAYQDVHDHCHEWQTKTFPEAVSLAADVYDYGTHKAPTYYPPILKEAETLEDDPDNAQAKSRLKAILQNLQATASDYQKKANDVHDKVQEFAVKTEADRKTLVGDDGKSGLLKRYEDDYGKKSTRVEQLTNDIAGERQKLKDDTDEYHRDVIIASTTPTYAWIYPAGTIAAAVVAGVYGKKATEALEDMRADQDKIDMLEAEEQALVNLMTAIHLAVEGVTNIKKSLLKALPVIRKVEKFWGAIGSDIGDIVTLIDTNIGEVPPAIMNLGVADALDAWKAVADAANAYRVNAFITTTDPSTQAPPQPGTPAPRLRPQLRVVA